MTIRIDGTNTAANPGITGSDTDTGLQFGTDEVNIVTGGSTAVTVDSSQRVGLGINSPARILHTSGDLVRFDNNGASAILLLDTSNSEGFRLVTNRTSGAFSIEDMGTAVSGAGTERLVITSDGTLQLRNSPGIDFSQIQTNAAGVDSEILDSYEQGTWTPVVFFNGVTTGVTYTEQEGVYVKIGNFVWASMNVTLSNNGTGSGAMTISLPFASGGEGATRGSGIVSLAAGFLSLNSTPAVYLSAPNQSTCRFVHLDSSSGSGTILDTLTNSNVPNTAQWRAAISYTTF